MEKHARLSGKHPPVLGKRSSRLGAWLCAATLAAAPAAAHAQTIDAPPPPAVPTPEGVGAAARLYAWGGRKHCPTPSINDPNFAAETSAWGACNSDNQRTTTMLGLIGIGAIIAGAAGWAVLAPGRPELLEVVNKHNRLSPKPLRLQIGFNPQSHLAFGGATLAF